MDPLLALDGLLAFSDSEGDSPIPALLDALHPVDVAQTRQDLEVAATDVMVRDSVSPHTPARAPGSPLRSPPPTPTPIRITQVRPPSLHSTDDDDMDDVEPASSPTPVPTRLPPRSQSVDTPRTPEWSKQKSPSPLRILDRGDGVRILGADSTDPGVEYSSPATQRIRGLNEPQAPDEMEDADDESPSQVSMSLARL